MGKQVAGLEVYGAHRRALIDYAERIAGDRTDAEDVVQDAWLHLKQALERGALRDPVPYLYRIVRNLAIDAKRKAKRQSRHIVRGEADSTLDVPDDAPSPETIIVARDDLQRLEAAMQTLPERQRIAIEMYRLGGHKLREIAERLNISVSLAHLLVVQGLAECHRLFQQDPAAEDE